MVRQGHKEEAADKVSLGERLRRKLQQYSDTAAAAEWLSRNRERVEGLFTPRIRDFVFEPIKDVFRVSGRTPEDEIRAIITRVAVANAVLAGLPGKMGVGVAVSIALEGWMAYGIARRVGLNIETTADIWKYFSVFAGIAVTILFLFRTLLGFGFSLGSFLFPVNPMIFAELLVTNFVGVCFWFAFDEARKAGSFTVPSRAYMAVARETRGLYRFQYQILKRNLSPSNLRIMWDRLTTWLRGDIPINRSELRGEIFATAAMGVLLAREYSRLEGPLGEQFLESIRDLYPDLAAASIGELSDHMSTYNAEQLAGVVNQIKGRLFERLVVQYENDDGDAWRAHLHEDPSFPGSDMTLVNSATGEYLELSLKATDSPGYIEEALLRYPEIPIMTTEEISAAFADNAGVMGHGLSNAEITRITEENFEVMLDQIDRLDASEIVASGIAAGAIANLWPFVAAYLRHRITYEQLREACVRALGQSGKAMAARLSYAAILGPVFAWYLLARGAIGLTKVAEDRPAYRLSINATASQFRAPPRQPGVSS